MLEFRGSEEETLERRDQHNKAHFKRSKTEVLTAFFSCACQSACSTRGAHSHTWPVQNRQLARWTHVKPLPNSSWGGGHGVCVCVWQTPAVVTTGRTTAATLTTAALSLSVSTEVIRQGICAHLIKIYMVKCFFFKTYLGVCYSDDVIFIQD